MKEKREIYVNEKKKPVVFCTEGLDAISQVKVEELVLKVLNQTKRKYDWALSRCTFFADDGIGILEENIKNFLDFSNPRVEGCDKNPFNQHYWLAFDTSFGPVIVDPIFGYVGLEAKANLVIDDEAVQYYQGKRVVDHTKPAWEGGIRIKTISI